jgi:hypothetical protein
MLSIRIDSVNKFLDLYSNQEIPVTISNPLFSQGVTDGSFLFNFQIPNTPKNASLLNFPARISRIEQLYNIRLQCTLFWKYSEWKKGSLRVVKASPIAIECSVGINESAFISEVGSTMLPKLWGDESLFLGNDMEEISDNITAKINSFFPSADFCYPTYHNPSAPVDIKLSALGAKYATIFPFVNYFRDGHFDNWILYDAPHLIVGLLSPQIYNSSVLSKVFSQFDISDNIFWSDSELNKLILFNTFINAKFYKLQWFVDLFHSLVFNNNLKIANTLPNVSVSDYLSALFSMFNAKLINNPDGSLSIISADSLINSPDIISLPTGSLGAIEMVDVENSVSGYSFSMKQISDGFQNDFIKNLDGYNIKGYVAQWINLPSSGNEYGDAYLVISTNRWYVWVYDSSVDDVNWVVLTENFPYDFNRSQYWEGLQPFDDPDFSVKTNAGTILNEGLILDDLFSPGRFIKVPKVDKKALVGSMYETYSNKWDEIAFLFYRGEQESSDPGNTFPFASYDNILNGSVLGNYSLAWDGEYGLYEKFHRSHFEMLKNSIPFKMSLNLSEQQLLRLDITKKYLADNMVLFFKKINFTLSGSSIKNINAEAYRI